MKLANVLEKLNSLANPEKISFKQKKFGISAKNSLGIYHKDLKILVKEIGYNNQLAIELFNTDIYEARILCSKIYNPKDITEDLMNRWVSTFENWEICDSFCMSIFARGKFALPKAFEWSKNKNEFIKRAGFTIMAAYGFADKFSKNETFQQFFIPIQQEADDDRLYVKKAVNWALRNIGKRNIDLKNNAIELSKELLTMESNSAKWIAKNALSELLKPEVKILDYPRSVYRPES